MDSLKDKAFIFGSIFTLSNKLQILGDRLDRNLTVKQWLLLAGIYNCGNSSPSISEVARIIGNSRQNVKKMLVILENLGFVTIENDPNDARTQKIRMTEKCLDYLKQRERKEIDFLEQLFEGFQPSELKELVRGIMKLENNMESIARSVSDEKE
ncbi:MAG: MarR family transcriptional regulator [Clostridiales bacterium]|nr:MarR family transcriptional regulator [Clostridiales bacterium]